MESDGSYKRAFRIELTKPRRKLLRELKALSKKLDSQGASKSDDDTLAMRKMLSGADEERMCNAEFPLVEELMEKYNYIARHK
jgi:hypothetical protein